VFAASRSSCSSGHRVYIWTKCQHSGSVPMRKTHVVDNVLKKLLNEVDMCHDHASAAVPLAPKLIQGVAVGMISTLVRLSVVCSARTYPSLRPSSSMSLTNFSQRSPVT
jgi:hypothetical protein